MTTSVPVHTVNGEVALQFLNTRTLFNISRTCIIYLILLNPVRVLHSEIVVS